MAFTKSCVLIVLLTIKVNLSGLSGTGFIVSSLGKYLSGEGFESMTRGFQCLSILTVAPSTARNGTWRLWICCAWKVYINQLFHIQGSYPAFIFDVLKIFYAVILDIFQWIEHCRQEDGFCTIHLFIV